MPIDQCPQRACGRIWQRAQFWADGFAKSGQHLWHFQTGGNVAASPMSYAVDGRQYVAVSAGNTLYAFTLPE